MSLISEETLAAFKAKGIRVTDRNRAAADASAKPNGQGGQRTMTKPLFSLPTIPTIQAAKAEECKNEEAFTALLADVPGHSKTYAERIASLLKGGDGHGAQKMTDEALKFCKADFAGVDKFTGDQDSRFKHEARMSFVEALLRQEISDRSIESVTALILDNMLEWGIFAKVDAHSKIGVNIAGQRYAPTPEYEHEVLQRDMIMLLSEKAQAAYEVGRDERRIGAAGLRAAATVRTASELFSVTDKNLTGIIMIRHPDGKSGREVKAATFFLWIHRQKGPNPKNGGPREITHEGGALFMVYRDSRISRNRDTKAEEIYEGLFVSLVPPTPKNGLSVVDGQVREYDNDGEAKYISLSEALKPLASPLSGKGQVLPPVAVPLECLTPKALEGRFKPPFFTAKEEFFQMQDLFNRLSWGLKRALQDEAEQAAHVAEKKRYQGAAKATLAEFFGEGNPVGPCYLFLTDAWKTGEGTNNMKFHRSVHFLGGRDKAGGEVIVMECPDKHKELLGSPAEVRKIFRMLEKVAHRVAAKNAEKAVAVTGHEKTEVMAGAAE